MKIAPFLLAVVALSGCVHVDQAITLNKDGSGRLEVSYGMSLGDLEQMQALTESAGGGEKDKTASATPFDFREEDIRKDFEEYARFGVKLDSVKTEEKDGWKYIHLKVAFRNLAGLAKTELVADRAVSLSKDAEGRYVFRQAVGEALPDVQAEGGDGESASAVMAGLMKGFRARVRVSVPGPIVESSGARIEGQTAEWEYDLEKDPKAVERLQRADMRVVFEGGGLDLPELKPAERAP